MISSSSLKLQASTKGSFERLITIYLYDCLPLVFYKEAQISELAHLLSDVQRFLSLSFSLVRVLTKNIFLCSRSFRDWTLCLTSKTSWLHLPTPTLNGFASAHDKMCAIFNFLCCFIDFNVKYMSCAFLA